MNYALDSYGDFEVEQQILATASRKKEELAKLHEQKDREILYRFKIIEGYFIRLSWRHKKAYVLSIFKRINCLDTLLNIISYVSTLYGKMAAYTDVSMHVRRISQQILLDHDRTTEKNCLDEAVCEDLNWIESLEPDNQNNILMDLLTLSGGGLLKKIYIPLVSIYNKKIMEDQKRRENTDMDWEKLFGDDNLDDKDIYPQDHPLSIEVERLRKKWDETIDKCRREVFGSSRAETQKKAEPTKSKKEGKEVSTKTGKTSKGNKPANKGESGSMGWFQMLPIWIVKKIMDYLDQKTLQNVKKVNPYWAYASESILKDRQAKKFLNQSIEKMKSHVDPNVLKQVREDQERVNRCYDQEKKQNSPREKRFKRLINRGAILKEMVPKIKQSEQTQSSLISSMHKNHTFSSALEQIIVFPRLIKEELLLYKPYPCTLKDVNIFIDVEDYTKKQRDTLSYALSQQLSDTFSMDEADPENW